MMTSWKKLITLVFLGVCLAAGGSYAGEKKDFSTTPKTKEGKKWRIAYYEGGPHQTTMTTFWPRSRV
jgi:hypothetical protein